MDLSSQEAAALANGLSRFNKDEVMLLAKYLGWNIDRRWTKADMVSEIRRILVRSRAPRATPTAPR